MASSSGQFLPVMFLEFISNLPEKFRDNTCEIQELPSKKPETFLKNSESKKKSERPQVVFHPTVSPLAVEHANFCMVVDVF